MDFQPLSQIDETIYFLINGGLQTLQSIKHMCEQAHFHLIVSMNLSIRTNIQDLLVLLQIF